MMDGLNAADIAGLAKLQSQQAGAAVKPVVPEKISKASEDFEAIFISQMLEHMFPEEIDPVFGDPETNDIYRSWQIDEYAKIIARSGGIGIASHVSEELLKLQDITSGAGRNKVTEALNAKDPKFYGLNR